MIIITEKYLFSYYRFFIVLSAEYATTPMMIKPWTASVYGFGKPS